MIKTVLPLLLYLLVPAISFSQSNQEKAQTLVKFYTKNHSESPASNALKFSSVQSLNSSYADTKTYKNYQHKIDSLKLEGRKIDARIVKMKTDAEINQAKKDSKNLSNQLVATSDAMIDFMTHFRSTPTGWQIKSNIPGKRKSKIYFLNKQLTQVTSVK